ncbi:hypothetical protein [Candidatus Enterococcus huntleyi]|nr:hypothetical protein [Enterococcus sp. JM4C]
MASMQKITNKLAVEMFYIIFCHAIGFTFATQGTSLSIFSKNKINR